MSTASGSALVTGAWSGIGAVYAERLGLDRGEVITIPPLADEGVWAAYDNARRALAPHLSRRDVVERYSQRLAT